jgi:hypothetical protein
LAFTALHFGVPFLQVLILTVVIGCLDDVLTLTKNVVARLSAKAELESARKALLLRQAQWRQVVGAEEPELPLEPPLSDNDFRDGAEP